MLMEMKGAQLPFFFRDKGKAQLISGETRWRILGDREEQIGPRHGPDSLTPRDLSHFIPPSSRPKPLVGHSFLLIRSQQRGKHEQ
mmetsp:Transcript_4878/g.21029  ORF Transcript_4878/g.21029 Transcript_4878/m.21029 type:complete len:85 (+) Transcript_4878:512-766(+)